MPSATIIAALLASTWVGASALLQAKPISMAVQTLQDQKQPFGNIWSGEDLISIGTSLTRNVKTTLIQTSANLHDRPREAQCDSVTLDKEVGPLVQMLGMKSVGSNLLLALASNNLNVSVLDRLNFGCSLLWKHSPPKQIMSGRPDIVDSAHNVYAIAIVRNPLSQFAHYLTMWVDEKNMCGAYFNLFKEMTMFHHDIPLEAFNYHCGPEMEQAPSWDGGHTYQWEAANLAQLWNEYVSGYLEDLDTMGFRRTMVIRFEDLVIEPEVVMKMLANFVGVPAPNETWVPMRPQGPSVVTQKAAMMEIVNSTYLERYTPKALQVLCSQLDLGLLRRLNYTDCEPIYAR